MYRVDISRVKLREKKRDKAHKNECVIYPEPEAEDLASTEEEEEDSVETNTSSCSSFDYQQGAFTRGKFQQAPFMRGDAHLDLSKINAEDENVSYKSPFGVKASQPSKKDAPPSKLVERQRFSEPILKSSRSRMSSLLVDKLPGGCSVEQIPDAKHFVENRLNGNYDSEDPVDAYLEDNAENFLPDDTIGTANKCNKETPLQNEPPSSYISKHLFEKSKDVCAKSEVLVEKSETLRKKSKDLCKTTQNLYVKSEPVVFHSSINLDIASPMTSSSGSFVIDETCDENKVCHRVSPKELEVQVPYYRIEYRQEGGSESDEAVTCPRCEARLLGAVAEGVKDDCPRCEGVSPWEDEKDCEKKGDGDLEDEGESDQTVCDSKYIGSEDQVEETSYNEGTEDDVAIEKEVTEGIPLCNRVVSQSEDEICSTGEQSEGRRVCSSRESDVPQVKEEYCHQGDVDNVCDEGVDATLCHISSCDEIPVPLTFDDKEMLWVDECEGELNRLSKAEETKDLTPGQAGEMCSILLFAKESSRIRTEEKRTSFVTTEEPKSDRSNSNVRMSRDWCSEGEPDTRSSVLNVKLSSLTDDIPGYCDTGPFGDTSPRVLSIEGSSLREENLMDDLCDIRPASAFRDSIPTCPRRPPSPFCDRDSTSSEQSMELCSPICDTRFSSQENRNSTSLACDGDSPSIGEKLDSPDPICDNPASPVFNGRPPSPFCDRDILTTSHYDMRPITPYSDIGPPSPSCDEYINTLPLTYDHSSPSCVTENPPNQDMSVSDENISVIDITNVTEEQSKPQVNEFVRHRRSILDGCRSKNGRENRVQTKLLDYKLTKPETALLHNELHVEMNDQMDNLFMADNSVYASNDLCYLSDTNMSAFDPNGNPAPEPFPTDSLDREPATDQGESNTPEPFNTDQFDLCPPFDDNGNPLAKHSSCKHNVQHRFGYQFCTCSLRSSDSGLADITSGLASGNSHCACTDSAPSTPHTSACSVHLAVASQATTYRSEMYIHWWLKTKIPISSLTMTSTPDGNRGPAPPNDSGK